MDRAYKPSDPEFRKLRNIRIAHIIYLKLIEEALIKVAVDNRIIFRRDPDSRIKSTKSILNKYQSKDSQTKKFIPFVNELKDVAGLRLTITAKDEFVIAENILVSSKVLKKYGVLDTTSRKDNGIMNTRGYAAYHYYIRWTLDMNDKDEVVKNCIDSTLENAKIDRSKLDASYNVTAELQLRTLAQDLWAVFEHPERYKGNGVIHETVNTELYNYAKLMDVADDIAKLTKNRKIHEAEDYFESKRITTVDKKKLLSVEVLSEEIQKFKARKIEDPGIESTFDLCELLQLLAKNGVFTCEDLRSLLQNSEYRNLIFSVFEQLKINQDELNMAFLDSFQLLFICKDCQIRCESLKGKEGDQSKAIKEAEDLCWSNLVRKITEFKEEYDLTAIINNYEVS